MGYFHIRRNCLDAMGSGRLGLHLRRQHSDVPFIGVGSTLHMLGEVKSGDSGGFEEGVRQTFSLQGHKIN